MLSTRRHVSPNLPNIKLGERKTDKRRIATDGELHQLNQAIIQLNQAKSATTEASFIAKVTEACKIARNIARTRIL